MAGEYVLISPSPNALTPLLQASTWEKLHSTETTGKVTMMITAVTESTIQRTVIEITTVAVDIALALIHHHVVTDNEGEVWYYLYNAYMYLSVDNISVLE